LRDKTAYNHQYYLAHKEKYTNDKTRLNAKLRMRQKRLLLNRYKMAPCTDCHIQYNPWVMEFDHLRDKKYIVSHMTNYKIARLEAEIAKCELVCANCHKERTHKRTWARLGLK